MKFTLVVSLILVMLISVTAAFAQEPLTWGDEDFSYYEAGNQNFSFKGGTKIPLFIYKPNDPGEKIVTGQFDGLGWSGSIGWERFITNSLALGVELGFSSNTVVSGDSLSQVPVFFTTTWYPLMNKVDIPISMKIGAVYTSLNDLGDQVYFGTVAAPTVGVLWRAFDSWSFGIETSYWLTPEIYFGAERREKTALGNFLTIAFTAAFTNR